MHIITISKTHKNDHKKAKHQAVLKIMVRIHYIHFTFRIPEARHSLLLHCQLTFLSGRKSDRRSDMKQREGEAAVKIWATCTDAPFYPRLSRMSCDHAKPFRYFHLLPRLHPFTCQDSTGLVFFIPFTFHTQKLVLTPLFKLYGLSGIYSTYFLTISLSTTKSILFLFFSSAASQTSTGFLSFLPFTFQTNQLLFISLFVPYRQ